MSNNFLTQQLAHPKMVAFINSSKLDIEYQKPNQKEVTAIILYKRVIGSSEPDTTTQAFFYKQNITYRIKKEYIKEWDLTVSIQRNEIAQKECLDFDECIKRIKQGTPLNDEDIPVRTGAYTAIVYLLASKFNADFVRSPQPLSQDFSKNSWWSPYVDVELGKKTAIETDEVIEILSSGKSCGFMSEDHTRRYI